MIWISQRAVASVQTLKWIIEKGTVHYCPSDHDGDHDDHHDDRDDDHDGDDHDGNDENVEQNDDSRLSAPLLTRDHCDTSLLVKS